MMIRMPLINTPAVNIDDNGLRAEVELRCNKKEMMVEIGKVHKVG